MYHHNLFYYIYIALLFISTYAYNYKYCKDDICVSCDNRIELGTIIIPNKEGKNVTYITETCSTKSIETDFCSSKNCTADTECLSNKCFKGHCAFNEANPIVQCQEVRTIHSSLIFSQSKGYKYQCGLPAGDKCKSNKDCSSHNCEKYNKDKICGEPDDSGCHSTCGWSGMLAFIFLVPLYLVLSLIFCCYFCCSCRNQKYKQNKNLILILFIVLFPIPWILLLLSDLYTIIKEGADVPMGYIGGIVGIILISAIIIYAIRQSYNNKEKEADEENLK